MSSSLEPSRGSESGESPDSRVSGHAHVRVHHVKAGPGLILSCLVSAVVLGILAVLLAAFAVAAGAALIGGALAYFGFRRVTGGLATVDELAARSGVTPLEMERLISERQLRPSAVINGRMMYDSLAVKDAAKVIRAGDGPVVDVETVPSADSGRIANDGRVIDVEDSTSHFPPG